ncbi:MAG TPA: HAMP domain-containing sensor histidine kinase [Sphingomicrobium sp.]
MLGFLLTSLVLRRRSSRCLARGFVTIFLLLVVLDSQWVVAALGAHGRLTSAYPLMLLSLALLFVLPPRIVALALALLFVNYCVIVLGTPTGRAEKIVAIENTAIVSVITLFAAALIHAGRRNDHEQKREIRLQNDRLRDRNVELDTLMAITAHDLRSPLYGLRNLFDLAVQRAPEEPELPLVVLRQARASIAAMLALATRLLDAHAAEHRPLTRLVEEDLRGHVMAVVRRSEPLARSAAVRIVMDLPDRPLIALLDTAALAQILDNLMSNGVRFSPAGGILTIVAASRGSCAAITIRDQGPGIDPVGRDALFKKFHRGDGAPADAMPGTGMGLFIVATLADRIGADVWCESVPGEGATFVVSFPAPQDTIPSS